MIKQLYPLGNQYSSPISFVGHRHGLDQRSGEQRLVYHQIGKDTSGQKNCDAETISLQQTEVPTVKLANQTDRPGEGSMRNS
jgi:hypothetical protein